jgi:hypothetical protein
MRSLQNSVDRLTEAFDRMATRLESLESNGIASTDGDRFTRHIRRYMPFYALASVWALMLILLPTRQTNDATEQAGQVVGGVGGQTFQDGTGGSVAAGNAGGTARAGRRAGGGGESFGGFEGEIPEEVKGLDALAWDKRGITRGGFECGPGIRQLPWSRYAAPCYPRWEGNNGGSTWRGVTAKEIVIVQRDFPDSANSQAVDAVVQQAGFASETEREATYAEFVKYFNKVFELWGRQIKIIRYVSEFGDSTEEAQSRGKEGACADADSIIDKYKPFMVIPAGGSHSSPFSECAAERKLTAVPAGAYYPENWYRKYHPYLWGGVMECERIAYQLAEYVGKRLSGRPAKWAKNLQKNLPRVFGTYVPNNDQYQHCVRIAEKELKEKYDTPPGSRYNYTLDISRFPDEAAKAVVQFNADGVTTVILACDPISPIFLTQSARGQEYWPEWITNGAGLTDVDQFARLWDQEEIQWSLFGMSQLGDLGRIQGPKGEGVVAYKRATGTDIPPGAQVEYYAAMGLFSILQSTGPILTPFTLAETYWRAPPGGAPEFEVGYTSYLDGPDGTPGGRDHTAVDDHKEIYWLCTRIGRGDAEGSSRCEEPKGYDDKGGVYIATYDGRRFRNNQWPRGDPPVFPEYRPTP